MQLIPDLWHGRVPFQRLLWRHLAVYGSVLNLVFGLATLALLERDELTEMALEDPSCGGNPIAMTRENTRALFAACM